ncbi:MAG TPA: site-specific DNA-methyltransferase [Gammaproteobacteria bacterium]|nr:site-specific DNA-methyltransferase [Gammaproteobacteria bacterium]
MKSSYFETLKGKVQLIFTSPPFPLNRKKRYGNLTGADYVNWLASFAPVFRDLLADSGSVVIELGNAWVQGSPTMSTLPLRSLLAFQEAGDFHLCQELVWHNPARLPGPAQWVTVERIRLKDSHTRFWWLSKSARPKADNKRVLQPYSAGMKRLLKTKVYNGGRRPSEHNIGEHSFLTDHGGAISPSVLVVPNTRATDSYQQYCRKQGLSTHPARMPLEIPKFFIKFLTDEDDVVLDPFGGSNTTGYAAEILRRSWLSIEANPEYVSGSYGRFLAEEQMALV